LTLKQLGEENASLIWRVARAGINQSYERDERTDVVLCQKELRVCSTKITLFRPTKCYVSVLIMEFTISFPDVACCSFMYPRDRH
jgi:hypothetical protein